MRPAQYCMDGLRWLIAPSDWNRWSERNWRDKLWSFLDHWLPIADTGRSYHFMAPADYARLLWDRATWRPDPYPVPPKNRTLVVPIATRPPGGCCSWSGPT